MLCVSETVAIDGDDPHHLDWIYQRSLERAEEFRITGLTYRLTQGRSQLQLLLKLQTSKEICSFFYTVPPTVAFRISFIRHIVSDVIVPCPSSIFYGDRYRYATDCNEVR